VTDRLHQIESPRDLQGLSTRELEQLASEIRTVIVEAVSKTGGHLAPNLGVVELTLALHTVFDSPRDKLLWDVGHQSYVHKILTGRLDRLSTLRQPGGLSGFCKRVESPHDAWEAGHACTSISGALGYARARDLRGENYNVVAVIGDGALTGGMAYEALNNAGHDDTDLVVLLNDNSMSISPNVGAMATYLNRLRTEPAYERLKHDLERILSHIPRFGSQVTQVLEQMKDGVRRMVLPGALFEALGFSYLGPIDGHDIEELQKGLRYAKQRGGPWLVHALTIKGRGYRPAERDPALYHGVGPFDVSTGKPKKKGGKAPSYSEVFGKTLTLLASERPDLVAITAAMPEGTGLSHFAAAYPDRFFDVGIAEQHAVGFAAGLAAGGLHPVVAIYSTFLQRAFDQVAHDVCLQNLPVVFALDRAGIVGGDGETHQGLYDYAYLRILPNMVAMAPRDENELRHMLRTAAEYDDGPIALRYPRGGGLGVGLDDALHSIPLGQGETLREGDDMALIAVGPMVHRAMDAAGLLADKGIDAAVIDARFIKPLDEALLVDAAVHAGRVITIEEAVLPGGFGSAVLELLAREGVLDSVRVSCLGLPDEVIPHVDREAFLAAAGLSAEGIAACALRLLEGSGRAPNEEAGAPGRQTIAGRTASK